MTLTKSLESKLHKLLKMMSAHFTNDHPDPDQTIPCKYLDAVEGEINALIQSELKKQREDIRKQLPEKARLDKAIKDGYWYGYNDCLDQITKILDSLEKE